MLLPALTSGKFYKISSFKVRIKLSLFFHRFANKFLRENKEYRFLYKAYGIRFIINISGQAGKFSMIPLFLTIGAGIGLMSISGLIADFTLLNCTKKKKIYQKIKEISPSEVETDAVVDIETVRL